jgi:hypothetical protein
MNTDKHGLQDAPLKPPSVKRVVERSLVLACLSCRGAIEQDAGNPNAEQFRGRVFEWLKQSGAEREVESAERAILLTPLGKLSKEQHAFATWQAEGLVVLAWALYLAGLPSYENRAAAKQIADSVGWLTDKASKLNQSARLRPTAEVQILADKLFALDWRLADFQQRKTSMDFQDFAKTAWFGPLNVEGLRFANGDLSIGGMPISKASEATRGICRLIAINRRHTAEWLLGQTEIYSEVDLST